MIGGNEKSRETENLQVQPPLDHSHVPAHHHTSQLFPSEDRKHPYKTTKR